MVPNTLQSSAQAPTAKHYLAQNIISIEAEIIWLKGSRGCSLIVKSMCSDVKSSGSNPSCDMWQLYDFEQAP